MSRRTFYTLVSGVSLAIAAYAWVNLCIHLWQNAARTLMSKNGCHCGEVAK